MSRFGGFRLGKIQLLTNWATRVSPSAASTPAPTTISNFDYTTAKGIWSLKSTTQFPKKNVLPPLYSFSTFTFTNAGASGRFGPSLANALSAYNTTANTWLTDTSFFNATSGIQFWTVPQTGTYRIEVWGARGGSNVGGSITYAGGYGARMRGDFTLTRGDVIKILVGQMGASSYGGGGGGTFVATNANVPLIVAGGGNSTSAWSSTLSHAPTTTSGLNGSSGAGGGTGGNGGTASGNGSVDGGGGFSTNGTAGGAYNGTPPQAFVNGGNGNQNGCNNGIGGFGGGSASDGCQFGQSGAGGGYSGGGGGTAAGSVAGGAGGSYNIGTNQSNDAGNTGTATRNNHGQAIITLVT